MLRTMNIYLHATGSQRLQRSPPGTPSPPNVPNPGSCTGSCTGSCAGRAPGPRRSAVLSELSFLRTPHNRSDLARAGGSNLASQLRPAGADLAEGASYLAEACSTSELTLIHFCIVLTHRRPQGHPSTPRPNRTLGQISSSRSEAGPCNTNPRIVCTLTG